MVNSQVNKIFKILIFWLSKGKLEENLGSIKKLVRREKINEHIQKNKSVNPTDFNKFAEKNRKKEGVSDTELWPIDKLYKLLENEPGGFILIFDIHSCLGIKIEQSGEDVYTIKYRDPFYSDLRQIQYYTKTKEIIPNRSFKIQWFGKFEILRERNVNPGLQSFTKFKYELHLPTNHESIIQQDTFHCGDICSYLATKSTVTMFDNQVILKD